MFTPFDEGNRFKGFQANDPSTKSFSPHPNQSKLSQTQAKVQKMPKGPLPANSVHKRMSALARYRQSPAYRQLITKPKQSATGGNPSSMTQSADQIRANLLERAEAAIAFVQYGGKVENLFRPDYGHKMIVESADDFADSIIALLIDAGFDENLVEVETDGNNVIVYLDERSTSKHKDVRNLLAEIGIAEMVAEPDDNPDIGTFIYRIEPLADSDDEKSKPPAGQALSNDSSPSSVKEPGSVGESTSIDSEVFTESKVGGQSNKSQHTPNGIAPQPDTRNKKGQRVMHDDNDTFTPKSRKKEEGAVAVSRIRPEKRTNRDMHEKVWVLHDNIPQLGYVVEIHDFGGQWESYLIRLDDGSMLNCSRRECCSTREDCVKKANKYRNPEDKIEGTRWKKELGKGLKDWRTTKHTSSKTNKGLRARMTHKYAYHKGANEPRDLEAKVGKSLSKAAKFRKLATQTPKGRDRKDLARESRSHRLDARNARITGRFNLKQKAAKKESFDETLPPVFTEALGSNPIPREGDVISDSAKHVSFRVERVLTNSKVEVQDLQTQKLSTVDRQVIERGLTSGTMQRLHIKESEVFTEAKEKTEHICPNCIVPLQAEGASFLCSTCSFVAEFADAGS